MCTATTFGFDDLNFGSRATSENVGRVISETDMAENMEVEVGIAAPSLTVGREKGISNSDLVVAILNSGIASRRRAV